jgi:MoaA/NifB/PqqE/SkfB family radical SAM enzyme
MRKIKFLLNLPFTFLSKYFEFNKLPFFYVFLMDYRCNSKCKTCGLWKSKNEPEIKSLDWFKIIDSIKDSPFWFTFTGGEPFLIKDFDKIVKYSILKNNPSMISFPTNGTLPEVIYKKTKSILESSYKTDIVINLSLDHLFEKHDELRGNDGNFEKLIETINLLKPLKRQYPNFYIGINTVISKYNINEIYTIYNYVKKLIKPDDHIFEVSQERFELNSKGQDFKGIKVKQFLKFLIKKDKKDLMRKKDLSFLKTYLRIKYYKSIFKKNKKMCNAGIMSAEIMPNADVIRCGINNRILGNLKDYNYNFKKLWKSKQARKLRSKQRRIKCNCDLVSVFYINQF